MARNVESTLVPVGAGESVSVPASSALAFKASICICAVRIYVTSAIVDETLVDVDALAVESCSDVVVADVARAVVRPPEIGTEGIAVASVESEVGALVDVEAGVVANPVAVETIIASAREASHGVVASCFNVARSILVALVDINAGSIVVAASEDPVESITDVARVMRAVINRTAGGVKIAVASDQVGFARAANDAGD